MGTHLSTGSNESPIIGILLLYQRLRRAAQLLGATDARFFCTNGAIRYDNTTNTLAESNIQSDNAADAAQPRPCRRHHKLAANVGTKLP